MEIDAQHLGGIFESGAEIITGLKNFHGGGADERGAVGGRCRRSIVTNGALKNKEPGNTGQAQKGAKSSLKNESLLQFASAEHGRLDYRAVI